MGVWDDIAAEFEPGAYRALNPGLADMGDDALVFHYQAHGKAEGRRCSRVHDRSSFIAQLPPGLKILEIGPFWAPAFKGPEYHVAYLDVFDREELQRRAAEDPNGQGAVVPEIDFIWRGERYRDLVGREFDMVYSSHNIEHQSDLITHLQDVQSVLGVGGVFCLVVPDKRYCFDHFLPESTIAGVIEAHIYRRRRHSLATLLTDRLMHTHNDSLAHWQGHHGVDPRFPGPIVDRAKVVEETLARSLESDGYVDAHAWQFSPELFRSIVGELDALRFTAFRPLRVYQTVYGSFEFYAVLERR